MSPPPAIPPPAAFTVGGRVPAAVSAALAEARRIRDAWAEAVEGARADAAAEVRQRYGRSLRALHRWAALERRRLEAQAEALAAALATRLLARPLAAEHLAALRLTPGPVEIRLHPTDAAALGPLPPPLTVVADPTLQPGDVVLTGPAGRVDARAATRVQRLLAGARP